MCIRDSISADPEQIRRVINNIVGNSVKYMNKTQSYIAVSYTHLASLDNKANGLHQLGSYGIHCQSVSPYNNLSLIHI